MKNLIIIFSLILISSCGYQPLYSSKDIPFSIKQINHDESVTSRKIVKNLKRYENSKGENLYNITLNTSEGKNEIFKSKENNISTFRLVVSVDLKVEKNKDIILNKKYQKSFDYQSNEKKFDQAQYEKSLRDTLLDNISNEIIRDLFSLQ